MRTSPDTTKADVRDFWNEASCGEVYAEGDTLREQLESQAKARYELEPYVPAFAGFGTLQGLDVLEVGVGMGADHLGLARSNPKSLTGIDLTDRAIDFTRTRLQMDGLTSDLRVADAENLPFDDASFDLVYSWGVIHHSPDTPAAVREIHRVLRPGGRARVMIYSKWSLSGAMLWARYGPLAGRPLRSLADVYANYLESPGTKAYTSAEAREMFSMFRSVTIGKQLCVGDTLEGEAGQRHHGQLLSTARKLWPRQLIKRHMSQFGLFLLIEAAK